MGGSTGHRLIESIKLLTYQQRWKGSPGARTLRLFLVGILRLGSGGTRERLHRIHAPPFDNAFVNGDSSLAKGIGFSAICEGLLGGAHDLIW